MKVIFESHCEDRYFEAVGGRKLTNSFKYFHPDIELHFHGDAEIAEFKAIYPWLGWASMDPILCGRFANDYDLIVHIDADSIVTGKLDDILAADYDLAGVRNNNDEGTASATGCIFGTHIPGIDARWQYLNAGLVAVNNKDFWPEFLDGVLKMPQHSGFGEQDVWNRIFWSGKYKSKLLDPVDSKVYYGVSEQLTLPGRPMQYHWAMMYMENGNLMLRGKVVKIIHHANGFGLPKLQYDDWVTPEVKDFLDEITKG